MVHFLATLLAISGLLDQPIAKALQQGQAKWLLPVCRTQIAVNCEDPLRISGYYSRERFAQQLDTLLQRYEAARLEWTSLQVEDNLAVQTLNIRVRDRFTGHTFPYRLIVFMVRDNEWRIYFLRGLRI